MTGTAINVNFRDEQVTTIMKALVDPDSQVMGATATVLLLALIADSVIEMKNTYLFETDNK